MGELTREKYTLVFCVLTYKNTADINDFLESVKKNCNFSYKVIIVNNFYNEESSKAFQNIAKENDCVFLESDNNGYGAGNNRGIAYAEENFDFDFLAVCNPDTVVKSFELDALNEYLNREVIIAPKVICRSGKKQNPMIIKDSKLANALTAFGYRRKCNFFVYCGIAVNKLKNKLMLLKKQSPRKVFRAHGCFVIFSKPAISALTPVYDEKVFMFVEEYDLGCKARLLGIPTLFVPKIDIYHKEDGSIKVSDVNVVKLESQAFLYFYDKWKKIK